MGCVWIKSWYSLTAPKHPVSLSVTLLEVTLTCATVWTTLWQQDGGSRNQGTASFPLHLVLQRPQEVQLLQQD